MLNTQYIVPFAESVRTVFATMMQLDVKVAETQSHLVSANYDISAIIGMSGDVVGSVALRMSEQVAKAVVGKFAGLQCEIEHPDFVDAMGELVNMVAGAAKAKFEGKDVSISTPAVVVGSGHRMACPANALCVTLPCELEIGTFAIDLAIREQGNQVKKAA